MRPSPSQRPKEKANPALLDASASKPSEARIFADPASHGLGSTSSCLRCSRARKVSARCAWVAIVRSFHSPRCTLAALFEARLPLDVKTTRAALRPVRAGFAPARGAPAGVGSRRRETVGPRSVPAGYPAYAGTHTAPAP